MSLADKAASWRAQYLRRAFLEGGMRLAGSAVAGLAALVWLDRTFPLAAPARWCLLAAGAAALAWGFQRLLLRPWLAFSWDKVLDRAELVHPELREYLKPAWELSRAGVAGTSEELRRAHLERTESLVARMPERPIFPWNVSKAGRRAGAAAMLGAFSMPWLSGSPSWVRVLAPWRDMPLERFVAVVPGDADVEFGRAVKIEARFTADAPKGRDRRELELSLDDGDGWKPARWDSASESGAAYSVEELSRPLKYRVSWRDLQSREYRLTPAAMPELDSLQVLVRGTEPQTLALTPAEPLSVLRGTMITITGKPNQPLASARMRLSTLPVPVAMKPGASGDYSASLVLQEDSSLRFELEAADGRRNEGSTTYSLKARPDMPPKIELLSPVEPLAASPRDSIPVSYSASDDGGLMKVSLQVRAKGMPQREIAIQAPRGRREASGDFTWELAGLPLGKVEFQLKAVDNAAAPQTGLSAVGALEIVDFAAVHADTQKSWANAQQSLDSLAARERQALTQSPPGDAELAQGWKDASQSYAEWARQMQNDAYANPGLAEAARAEAAALESARTKDLPEAQAAAKAGAGDVARARHEALASRVKQAQRLLAEGRKLQGLQDFYNEAGRLNQSGTDIESRLSSLAQRGAADPAAMRELQQNLQKLEKQMQDLQKAMQALPKVDANSPETKSRQTYELPLGDALSQADDLSRALARGDVKAAAEASRRLSEALSKIQRALGDAASDAASGGQQRQASERMSKAQSLWSEVIEDQTKVLEKTEALENARLQKKVAAQKDMLAELAKRQDALVARSAEKGAAFPQDALGMMRSVASELDARKVVNSVNWLRGVSARLRMEPPKTGSELGKIADEEDDIRQKLSQGPALPDEAPGPESGAVGAAQAQVRAKTRALQSQLEAIDADTGGVPSDALEKVGGAQGEQSGAEAALGKGRSTDAKSHEEAALSLLSSGSQSLSQAMSGAQSMQQGMSRGFSRPASGAFRIMSGGGGSGAQMSFVPLPSDKEYAPPRDLREELKKSMEENRPATYDGVIKEYFKRISQ